MGSKKKKKNNSKSMIFVLIAAALLFVSVIVFVVVMLFGNDKKNNKNDNEVSSQASSSSVQETTIAAETTIKETTTLPETTAVSIDKTENTTEEKTTEEETTEEITTVEETTQEPLRQPDTISIVAVGDNLIHSQIFESIVKADGGYDFSNVYDQSLIDCLSSADLTIINQETPACGNAYGVTTYPNFNAPTESIDSLINVLGADVLTLASNHSYDKDETGIIGTLNYIHTNYPGVLTTGTFSSYEESQTVPIIEVKGVKIAVLNYTYGLNYPYELPNPYEVNLLTDTAKIESDFAKAREQADFIICYPHWGDEYSTYANDYQKSYAQYFADLGADLIIGSHPHVCQEYVNVLSADGRTVPVYYSLGNFFSAQNYSPRTLGGVAKVELYVDEYGKCTIIGIDYDFTCTYYTVNQEWIFGNFKNYMLRDFPVELENSSGIKLWSTEFSAQLYKDIARSFNPNWIG